MILFRSIMFGLLIAAAVVLLGGCTTLDRKTPRTPSSVLSSAEIESTTLGRAWTAAAPDDPALSAFRLLPNNLEAFAARVAMIEAAERTLDLQYYIFRPDDTGLYLVDRMVAAADRGVRVRILIDDMCAHGIEKRLLGFDAHPNIEVRLFNPWKNRGGALVRGFEFLFNGRLNYRMHNKLFIADGILAILGGRNLADEYFTLNPDYDFRDLDVAAAGPVVHRSNELFDEFWNGDDAIPISGLKSKQPAEASLADAPPRLAEHRERMKASPYGEAVVATEFVQQLKSRSLQWVFARGQTVGDSPEKTTRADDPTWNESLADQAQDFFLSGKSELLISSPYFVPGKKLTQRICDMEAGGTQVRIITNSQASTDVPFVYSAYSKYRKTLLKGGVEVFELRVHQAGVKHTDTTPEFGSNFSSLHAKTFVIDRQSAYIGSLNLDPRSVVINTEIGLLIESPEIAESVANSMTTLMGPKYSYRVTISPKGKLDWVCVDASGNEVHFDNDPDTSWWDRFKEGFLGLLPIEGQI